MWYRTVLWFNCVVDGGGSWKSLFSQETLQSYIWLNWGFCIQCIITGFLDNQAVLHDDHAVYLLHAALVAKVLLHAKVCVEIAKTNSVLATSSASAAAASSAFSKQPTKSPDIYFAQMQSRESVHCGAIILFRGNHKIIFVSKWLLLF